MSFLVIHLTVLVWLQKTTALDVTEESLKVSYLGSPVRQLLLIWVNVNDNPLPI